MVRALPRSVQGCNSAADSYSPSTRALPRVRIDRGRRLAWPRIRIPGTRARALLVHNLLTHAPCIQVPDRLGPNRDPGLLCANVWCLCTPGRFCRCPAGINDTAQDAQSSPECPDRLFKYRSSGTRRVHLGSWHTSARHARTLQHDSSSGWIDVGDACVMPWCGVPDYRARG